MYQTFCVGELRCGYMYLFKGKKDRKGEKVGWETKIQEQWNVTP